MYLLCIQALEELGLGEDDLVDELCEPRQHSKYTVVNAVRRFMLLLLQQMLQPSPALPLTLHLVLPSRLAAHLALPSHLAAHLAWYNNNYSLDTKFNIQSF